MQQSGGGWFNVMNVKVVILKEASRLNNNCLLLYQ